MLQPNTFMLDFMLSFISILTKYSASLYKLISDIIKTEKQNNTSL